MRWLVFQALAIAVALFGPAQDLGCGKDFGGDEMVKCWGCEQQNEQPPLNLGVFLLCFLQKQ